MYRIYQILIFASVAVLAIGYVAILVIFGEINDEQGKNAASFVFMASSLGMLAVICLSSIVLFAAGSVGYIYQETQQKGLFWNYRWPLLLGAPGTALGMILITNWLLAYASNPLP